MSDAGGRAAALLRRQPPALLHAVALALVVWLLLEDAGFPLRRWGVVALLVATLGVVAVTGLPRPRRPAPAALAALSALAAFTAWTYLSILWAGTPGQAWVGANRTLLGTLLFALAVLWPPSARAGRLLVTAFAAAVGLLALVTLIGLAGGAGEQTFVGTRLTAPAGYPNATAALWLLGAWPALVLAARPEPGWVARGALAGVAVVLLGLALMAESRGALFATPIVLAAVLLLLPGRVRLLTVLLVAGGATAAVAGVVLDVNAAIGDADGVATGPDVATALDRAVGALLLAAAATALVVGGWAAAEGRRVGGAGAARAAHRAGAVVGVALAAGLAVVVVAADPVDRARSAWSSFKGGYAENAQGGSRLTSGLGSDRYDFYRVALRAFGDAPVRGEGIDQFRQRYLREGTGGETPRYPHSLPLRLLAQTGLVGTLLFAVFVIAAILAAMRAMRTPAGAATAAAALAAFASWGVHGSADWFMEIAGLAAAASYLLGLAVSAGAPGPRGAPLALTRVGLAAAAVWAVVLLATLALPWLADRELAEAGRTLARDPDAALVAIDRAARLDPLSAAPPLAEGTARLRLGDVQGADAAFAEALRRAPDDHYATLMRGAIASAQGRRQDALLLLERARRQAPRDEVAVAALEAATAGRVDLGALQRSLLLRAQ